MLNIRNLKCAYRTKGSTNKVFDGVNIQLSRGLNVILGPNGAGKSTLLKVIFGLLKHEGEVYYGDLNLSQMRIEDKTDFMAYLPQMDVEISTLTVLEMVLLGLLPELGSKITDEDLRVTMKTLESLNIEALASRNFGELSGGPKKLVFIAQTLVRKPELILLDEPVNSLDLQKQLELCHLLKNIVREQGVDIVMVLHDINLAARYGDYIVVMDACGRCYDSGSAQEVISSKMLKDVYGVQADVNMDEKGVVMIAPIRSIRSC